MVASYSRERHRGENCTFIHVSQTGYDPQTGQKWSAPAEDRALFVWYDVLKDNRGKKSDWHDCYHDKMRLQIRKITRFSRKDGGLPEWRCDPFWIPESPYLLQYNRLKPLLNSDAFDRGSEPWQTFEERAFNSFVEQIPRTIDVVNLLIDLKDLKGLLKQGKSILGRLQRNLQRLGAYKGHFSHLLTLRELMRNVADAFLIKQFAVNPLIREIESVFEGTTAIMKRLVFLRETQGRVFTARYMERHSFSKPDTILDGADKYSMYNATLNLKQVSGVVTYTSQAVIKNDLKGLDDISAGFKAYLKSLGAGNLITFLWDRVPLSFVIDWNYNVSGLLDRYASWNPFQGELKVQSAGTTFKKVCTGKLVVVAPTMTDPPGGFDFGTLTLSSYDRQSGLDGSLNMFKPFSELSSMQQALLGALVIQRA